MALMNKILCFIRGHQWALMNLKNEKIGEDNCIVEWKFICPNCLKIITLSKRGD